mmetsp:Transcript_34144/g.44008  ORF Transcript_34144/g.44008 Transcript_34144/m.44008 type:complete len:85 (-) Transcript_34144:42-296(-)
MLPESQAKAKFGERLLQMSHGCALTLIHPPSCIENGCFFVEYQDHPRSNVMVLLDEGKQLCIVVVALNRFEVSFELDLSGDIIF